MASYSEISNIIQGEEEVGISMLKEHMNVIKSYQKELVEAENKVKSLKSAISYGFETIYHISKHLNIEYPINVLIGEHIVTCTENNEISMTKYLK